jgi:hypothetical protein
MRAEILGTVNFLLERFGEALAHVGGGEDGSDFADGLGASWIAVVNERSPWRPPTTNVRYAVERRLVGLSTRFISASVNYIRGKCGKCLRLGGPSYGI